MQPPYPPQPKPAKRKNERGCLMALAAVAFTLFAFAIIVGIIANKVMSSKEGQRTVKLMGEGAKLFGAANAPGTEQLRAMGCNSALVVESSRLEAIAELLDVD